MLDPSTLALFVVAALVLLITPGPSVLYIIARSVDQGRAAGVASTLGVGAGSLCHIAAAALGVSALLVSSALALAAVKYLGAAYLIYLGVRKMFERSESQGPVAPARASLPRIFYQGFLVNLLNPKTALFFFAFLPQFVDPARGAAAAQILLLGLIFVTLGICSDGLYALLAGAIGGTLRGSPRFLRSQRYLVGGVYIALGVTTAIVGTEKK